MNAKRPRGRPSRIERDIALLLCTEWHRQIEGLSSGKAAEVTVSLWQFNGRGGLGRYGTASKAVFRSLRKAAAHLGAGRFIPTPGVEVNGKLHDAVCYFVPTGTSCEQSRRGDRQVVRGACWRWAFPSPEAQLMDIGIDPEGADFPD